MRATIVSSWVGGGARGGRCGLLRLGRVLVVADPVSGIGVSSLYGSGDSFGRYVNAKISGYYSHSAIDLRGK